MADLQARHIIAAIDFGTMYSGFSHKLRGKDAISVYTDWEQGRDFSYKTPTCVLFDSNRNVEFGHKAIDVYTLKTDEQFKASEFQYFKYFKMELYRSSHTAKKLREVQVQSTNGKSKPAIDVFAGALKKLKELCLHDCDQKYDMKPTVDDILWVLTVPAIWRDASKNFMRLAAYRAGIIPTIESRGLIIALEPEAAGLLCRTLPIAKFDRKQGVDAGLQSGTAYLVIDTGGGTVDIAALQEVSEFCVRHIHFEHGKPHGGNAVNRKFVDLLNELLDNCMNEFKTSHPADFEELMLNFERAKWNFNGKSPMRIDLSFGFSNFRNKNVINQLVKDFNQRRSSDVQWQSGKLCLPADLANGLFEEVVSDIIKCTRELFVSCTTPIKYFFLVGGFAKTELLFERMKAEFPFVKVLRPDQPGFAVLKGSVIFGENMLDCGVREKDESGQQLSIVQESVMSRSYGVIVRSPFNEEKHGKLEDLERDGLIDIKTVDGKQTKYRRNVFFEYVRKGTSIKVDHSVTRTVETWDQNPDSLANYIYSHESVGSREKYITDEDSDGKPLCQFLGSVTLERTSKAEDYATHKVRLMFGGTEIQAFVKDTTTGLYTEKAIDYYAVEEDSSFCWRRSATSPPWRKTSSLCRIRSATSPPWRKTSSLCRRTVYVEYYAVMYCSEPKNNNIETKWSSQLDFRARSKHRNSF